VKVAAHLKTLMESNLQLACSDGEVRDFRCLKDILIERGFDENLLKRDRNMLACHHHPSIGFLDAFRMARNGIHVPFYFTYRSKKARRQSPVGFHISEIVHAGMYISFAPSIEDNHGNDVDGYMDSLTITARLLSRFIKKWNIQSEFRNLLAGPNADKVVYDYGYKLSEIYIPDDSPIEFLFFSNEDAESRDLLFAANGSVLGYCSKVYISAQ